MLPTELKKIIIAIFFWAITITAEGGFLSQVNFRLIYKILCEIKTLEKWEASAKELQVHKKNHAVQQKTFLKGREN